MHSLWMKKSHDVTGRSDRPSRCPFELQDQHRLIAHPTRSTEDGFDRGVDRLDNAEADRMVTVGRDPLDMLEEELSQLLHLGKALPPQCVNPAVQEIQDPRPRFVRPQPVEL